MAAFCFFKEISQYLYQKKVLHFWLVKEVFFATKQIESLHHLKINA